MPLEDSGRVVVVDAVVGLGGIKWALQLCCKITGGVGLTGATSVLTSFVLLLPDFGGAADGLTWPYLEMLSWKKS